MKKLLISLLVISLVAFALLGCSQPKTSEGTDAAPEKTMRIGIVTNSGTGFYNLVDSGFMDVLEPLGYTFVRGISEFNVATELQLVEDFLTTGVDAMYFTIADAEGSAEAITRCNEAGVPVFIADSLPSSTDIQYVACCMSNNIEAGEMVAKQICEKLGGKGKIALLDGPQITCVLERMQGFKNVIAQYPDIELAGSTMVSEHSIAGCTSTIENMLQADPDINAILCYASYGSMASETALTNVGRADVLIGAVDGTPEECEVIAHNTVYIATAGQRPYDMGKSLGEACAAYLADPASAKINQTIYSPLSLIDISNVEGYDGMDYSMIRSDIKS